MEAPLNLTTLFPLLAIGGSIMLFWQQAKDLLSKIIRLFIVEVQVENTASVALTFYLPRKAWVFPSNISKYSSTNEYIIRKKKTRILLRSVVHLLKNQIYWISGTLVSLSDKTGKDKETDITYDTTTTLRYLRGTLNHEKLITDAINWYESFGELKTNSRFVIERFVGRAQAGLEIRKNEPERSLGSSAPPGSSQASYLQLSRLINYGLDDIGYSKRDFFYVFNDSTRQLHDDVARWLKSKDWYEERGLLHRRGALLFGEPGSGKSAAIRKIAQELDMPMCLFELNTMSDTEFIDFWDNARSRNPCIVVFEDIDCTFNKRQNISKAGKLSFECLLNCISGIQPAEGIYLFVTTNRLDYLDHALGVPNEKGVSTRPGRLDTCFAINQITDVEKLAISNHFLADYPEEAKRLTEESNGCTAAQFSDMCSQKALELYWDKRCSTT